MTRPRSQKQRAQAYTAGERHIHHQLVVHVRLQQRRVAHTLIVRPDNVGGRSRLLLVQGRDLLAIYIEKQDVLLSLTSLDVIGVVVAMVVLVSTAGGHDRRCGGSGASYVGASRAWASSRRRATAAR